MATLQPLKADFSSWHGAWCIDLQRARAVQFKPLRGR
jgi:hypothetical protein